MSYKIRVKKDKANRTWNLAAWSDQERLVCQLLLNTFDEYSEVAEWMDMMFYPRHFTEGVVRSYVNQKTDKQISDRSPLNPKEIWYIYQFLRDGVRPDQKENQWKQLLTEFPPMESTQIRHRFYTVLKLGMQHMISFYVTDWKQYIETTRKIPSIPPRIWLLLFYFSHDQNNHLGFLAEAVSACKLLESILSRFIRYELYATTFCRWSLMSKFQMLPEFSQEKIMQAIEIFCTIITLYRVIVRTIPSEREEDPDIFEVNIPMKTKMVPNKGNIAGYLKERGITQMHAKLLLDSHECQLLIGILSHIHSAKIQDQAFDRLM